jgi:hypothetical protein
MAVLWLKRSVWRRTIRGKVSLIGLSLSNLQSSMPGAFRPGGYIPQI